MHIKLLNSLPYFKFKIFCTALRKISRLSSDLHLQGSINIEKISIGIFTWGSPAAKFVTTYTYVHTYVTYKHQGNYCLITMKTCTNDKIRTYT